MDLIYDNPYFGEFYKLKCAQEKIEKNNYRLAIVENTPQKNNVDFPIDINDIVDLNQIIINEIEKLSKKPRIL